MSNSDIERALQRARAEGWEQGFFAGCRHGAACERHDPQWDMDGPPYPPTNPYTLQEPRS